MLLTDTFVCDSGRTYRLCVGHQHIYRKLVSFWLNHSNGLIWGQALPKIMKDNISKLYRISKCINVYFEPCRRSELWNIFWFGYSVTQLSWKSIVRVHFVFDSTRYCTRIVVVLLNLYHKHLALSLANKLHSIKNNINNSLTCTYTSARIMPKTNSFKCILFWVLWNYH